jgi:hypothetical protein
VIRWICSVAAAAAFPFFAVTFAPGENILVNGSFRPASMQVAAQDHASLCVHDPISAFSSNEYFPIFLRCFWCK